MCETSSMTYWRAVRSLRLTSAVPSPTTIEV